MNFFKTKRHLTFISQLLTWLPHAQETVCLVSQKSKSIKIEELIDSFVIDAIPFVIKSHYFKLLFEVYLRKVQSQENLQRLPVTNQKFVSMLKYII